jgi:hypothetical protein
MEPHGETSRGPRFLRLAIAALALLLATQGAYKVTTGIWRLWAQDGDWDLQTRYREFQLFRVGVYPHYEVETAPVHLMPGYSVYPPYAFPMMAPLFEPWGDEQGRYIMTYLSMAGLVFLAACAYRILRRFGPEIAALGMAAAFAISGNKAVFLLGQFSIACTALILLQMVLLARGRPYAAGLCWTFAMIKPQIALPFAALFLLRRGQIPGLLAGMATLAALSWVACAWTGVGVIRLADHYLRGMSFAFSQTGLRIGPGSLASLLGVDHRIVVFAIFGLALAVGAVATLGLRRLGPPAMLPISGLCSVFGMLSVYHYMYDQIMLYPAVLATMVVAASTRRPIAIVIAAAMLGSLLPPMRLVEKEVVPEAIMAVIWIVAGIYPVVTLVLDSRRTKEAVS